MLYKSEIAIFDSAGGTCVGCVLLKGEACLHQSAAVPRSDLLGSVSCTLHLHSPAAPDALRLLWHVHSAEILPGSVKASDVKDPGNDAATAFEVQTVDEKVTFVCTDAGGFGCPLPSPSATAAAAVAAGPRRRRCRSCATAAVAAAAAAAAAVAVCIITS